MKRSKLSGPILLILLSGWLFNSCTKDPVYDRSPEREQLELNSYISNLIRQGLKVDTTDLGVYYIVKNEGEGAYPQQGDTLTIGYSAYFIDGSLFDSSQLKNADGTFTFRFLVDHLIPGFEDGIKLMNKGELLEMIIPSDLAYGSIGTNLIPPYTSLIFVTELKDIKPVSVNNEQ